MFVMLTDASASLVAVCWCVAGLVSDSVQQSYVSSSESAQNILANGIIGPLILEVRER